MQAEPHWEMASNEGTELGAGSGNQDPTGNWRAMKELDWALVHAARIPLASGQGTRRGRWPLAKNEGTRLAARSCRPNPTGRWPAMKEPNWALDQTGSEMIREDQRRSARISQNQRKIREDQRRSARISQNQRKIREDQRKIREDRQGSLKINQG